MNSNAAVNPLITPGGLTLYLLNATSLAKHCAIQQLGVDIMQLQPRVVLITETWFNSKHSNDCVSHPTSCTAKIELVGRVVVFVFEMILPVS